MTSPEVLEHFTKEHKKGVNRLKSFFKRYPRLYYLLWHIFCPIFFTGLRPGAVLSFFPKSENPIVLNIGSGPKRIHPSIINIDVVPFDVVDVVADASSLPFKDESVDAVLSENMLEHVADPHRAVSEMTRVLKRGGIMYASIPFLTPYHASPDDFVRFTKSGLRALFSDFELIKEGVDAGPWSAFLVFLAYWLGTIFSFGSKKAAPFFGLAFMLILGPLKVFDIIFARLPGAHTVAAQLYFVGRKK